MMDDHDNVPAHTSILLNRLVRTRDAPTTLELAATRITSFTGENEFLSTLFKSRVVLPGEGLTEEDYVAYPTVEHALQVYR